jgi:hypothetical protein
MWVVQPGALLFRAPEQNVEVLVTPKDTFMQEKAGVISQAPKRRANED